MSPVHEQKLWHDEMEALRQEIASSLAVPQAEEVREELQASLDALNGSGLPSTADRPFTRVIDLLPRPYVVTDHCGIIRRANKAGLSVLTQGDGIRLDGKPLLLFIDPADRAAFLARFLTIRRQHLYRTQFSCRLRPMFAHPHRAELNAYLVEHGEAFLGIVWVIVT